MKIAWIEIQNYKAFRDIERFDIDGKNVLIYGNNGSGKTSFAHALQALIQSSAKSPEQIQQAFDRTNDESIVNLDTPVDGVSFVRLTTDNGVTYDYSTNGNTQANAVLLGANQVSDYLNYRVLFRFHNYRDSKMADIYSIIRDEFFPYWTTSDTKGTYHYWLENIETELSSLKKDGIRRNSHRYKVFQEQLDEFSVSLQRQLLDLVEPANTFLKVYLAPGEPVEINFRFPRAFELDKERRFVLHPPIIQLVINYDGKPINRPHTFLNEARLTALALAIRLAAFEARPRRVSKFKILVLDDLLISLDMSLRMKVFQALVDSYKEYQIFILTHDKSFYNFLKQALGFIDSSWTFFELYENTTNGHFDRPTLLPGKDYLIKAEEYLNNKDYEASAVYLRKKAEELIRIYFDPTIESLTRYYVLDELANALGCVEREYTNKILDKLTALLECKTFTPLMIRKLLAEPFRGDNTLTKAEIGEINHLRTQILRLLETHYTHRNEYETQKQELIKIATRVSRLRSIILNPGAHQGNVSLYNHELQEALETLKAFEKKIKDKTLYSL